MPAFRRIGAAVVIGLTLLLSSSLTLASQDDVRRVWQLLDYLSVDYGGAVKDGAVISDSEFAEMREFARTSQTKIGELDAHPERDALVAEAAALSAAIDAKSDPDKVAGLAKGLANHLLAAYPVPSSPASPPVMKAAAALYQANCAACHGTTGNGDGPIGLRLEPRPVAFTDQARARERSVFALYQVITQGLEGTPMASFASLPDDDRWKLAFYIGQFAHSSDDASAGQKVWTDNAAVRAQLTGLDVLSRTTQADLAKQVGEQPAAQVMAYLHVHPEAVVQGRALSFDVASEKLAQSIAAYEQGDLSRAKDLALSAYLDGVEPIEPTLATRDSALMAQIETAMGQYRTMVAARATPAELADQIRSVDAMFARADALLSSNSDATASYLGSVTILVREGLEALLVVVAMIAFLRKAQRVDMLRYVHIGWVGALALGALTWAIATYLVSVSGASREVTEGLSSLFAAVVLLSVGMWMHQKSMAGMWQKYIHDKLSAALDRKSAWFIFGLSFIAVYREVFETILFYAALWEQGNHGAVLGGLATGVVILIGIAFALLKFSARLPIGKFFSWSSILVAILAVVLTGKGIAALQEAGWINAHTIDTPRVDLLGLYPSSQVVLAQLIVLTLIVIGFGWNARLARRSGSLERRKA